jgi:solute carrier family 25 protein 34/35
MLNTMHGKRYTGVWHALTVIVKQDGIKGLYRGSLLSMSRSILGSGANLASYSLMKEHLILEKGWADSAVLDMVCGLTSGLVSWYDGL